MDSGYRQEKEKCSICIENFCKKISLDDCKHNFCKDCIYRWVLNKKKSCPLCRNEISLTQQAKAYKYGFRNKLIFRAYIRVYDCRHLNLIFNENQITYTDEQWNILINNAEIISKINSSIPYNIVLEILKNDYNNYEKYRFYHRILI